MRKKLIVFIFSVTCSSCIHYITGYSKKHSDYSIHNKKSHVDHTIRDLVFFPLNGHRFRLSELKNMQAIVIVMRQQNCFMFEKHGYLLSQIEAKYSKKGIFFIYNYTGQLKKNTNAQNDLNKFNFQGPYVIDGNQTIASALGAKNATEIFILTPERRIVYKGPIYDLQSNQIKSHYLKNALESIISGNIIEPKEFPSVSCSIDYPVIKNRIFWSDVSPIIAKKCSTCHNPSGTSLINYLTYEDVAGRKAMFKYVIENDLMPPWGVDPNTGPWKNDLSLTSKEKTMIIKWIDDGVPKQSQNPQLLWTKMTLEKEEAPADYIIRLPEKVIISPEEISKYEKFVISTNFKEDKWIKSIAFRLKPKVIHHIIVFIMNKSFKPKHIESVRDYMLTQFVTNEEIEKRRKNKFAIYSENIGYRLPHGSKLVLEIHYESIGRKVIDDFTQIHINFHRKKPKYKSITYSINNTKFNIPSHALNYKVTSHYKTKRTMILLKVHPHMHSRGKANSIFVTIPGRERKRIFGIDPFIRIFEKTYELKTPLLIPKGSILECINWFDNSRNNPLNPDPNKKVTYGPFARDEMSQCYLAWQVPVDSNAKHLWIANP